MTDLLTTRIRGGAEFEAFIDRFPDKMIRNVMRGAHRAGAAPIRDEAKRRAPKRTGGLAKAIKTSAPKVGDGYVTVSIKLYPPSKGGSYNWFLGLIYEYGSRGYTGKLRGGNRRRSDKMKSDGSTFYGIYPDIAAHPAEPFMRPALDTMAGAAINAIGEYCARRLSIGDLQAPVISIVDEVAE